MIGPRALWAPLLLLTVAAAPAAPQEDDDPTAAEELAAAEPLPPDVGGLVGKLQQIDQETDRLGAIKQQNRHPAGKELTAEEREEWMSSGAGERYMEAEHRLNALELLRSRAERELRQAAERNPSALSAELKRAQDLDRMQLLLGALPADATLDPSLPKALIELSKRFQPLPDALLQALGRVDDARCAAVLVEAALAGRTDAWRYALDTLDAESFTQLLRAASGQGPAAAGALEVLRSYEVQVPTRSLENVRLQQRVEARLRAVDAALREKRPREQRVALLRYLSKLVGGGRPETEFARRLESIALSTYQPILRGADPVLAGQVAALLGALGGREALVASEELLGETNLPVVVRLEAARHLGRCGRIQAAPALIGGLSDMDGGVRGACQRSLEQVSGRQHTSLEEWNEWWRARGEQAAAVAAAQASDEQEPPQPE